MHRIERLWRTGQWWHRNRSRQRAIILLYHRVAESRSDPWALNVSPHYFAEHLEILQQRARPVRLQQLAQGLVSGGLTNRSVVITFDDGYADNLHAAKPLLERYGIPATVFLTTGYLGHEREFWWDRLERVLLEPGTLPESLRLSINGGTYRWELGETAHYSEDVARRHRSWKAGEGAPTARHSLYVSLWELLSSLAEGERWHVLDEIMAWGSAESASRSGHRPLSPEEAVDLAQGELIEVGAHTVTHPALSKLSTASQRAEILESKIRLQETLNLPVTSFSYPYGNRSAETVAIVREAGFACACSNVAGVVGRSTDLFQLPRIPVQDWDGDRFAKWLSRWFWLPGHLDG